MALVPARGGSKGVPRKNLRVIKGKPLIAHTLDAAKGSAYVDKVYLSSDDGEILEFGRSLNIETIDRDSSAATDAATAKDVVLDFIRQLAKPLIDENPYLVYLQPTSPLRTTAHIDAAFAELEAKGGSMSVSVVQLKKTPYKSFKLSEAGLLESLFEEKLSNANRQALPPTFYPNGAIYIFPLLEFIRNGGFPSNGSAPYIMSERESIDIDTEDDIAMMESL